ncbi:MAG: glycosyltransferase family 39 protein [Phycisphaerae bacterium]|nr:glycosyltransferase family 39 protein [Phycisphaerae bacterium]
MLRPRSAMNRYVVAVLRKPALLPIAVMLSLTLPHLGQGDFVVDTGWYAAIGLQAWRDAISGRPGALWTLMAEGGQGGLAYFNKPPLAFWVHGFALWAMGPSVLAARLPAVIAGAACVWLTVSIAGVLHTRRTGFLAGLILALTIEFTRHTRAFSLDVWQLLFLLAAARVAAGAVRRGSMRALPIGGVFVGLALLTKPLVGLVGWSLLMIWAWLPGVGRRGEHRRGFGWAFVGLIVAALIASPWHIGMVIEHGTAFTSRYFGHEIAARAMGTIDRANTGAANPLYYTQELVRHYLPWLISVLLGLVAWARGGLRRDAGMALIVVWTLTWFVILSAFADKRPRYLLPVFPFWAWLSAVWIRDQAPRWLALVRRAVVRWVGVFAIGGGMLVAALPVTIDRSMDPNWAGFMEFLRTAEMADEAWWQGGFEGARGARLYLEFGRWPLSTRDRSGVLIATPPRDAVILYHRRDGLVPGEGERTLYENADFRVTRLQTEQWAPSSRPDPGE